MSAPSLQDVSAGEQLPYYARAGQTDSYIWEGEKYTRVTRILSEAPGQFLMNWYSSQSAMKCASHLYEAGLVSIPEADEKLQEFCAGKTPRCITPEQAYVEILAWQMNMREPERYRDAKARIGSVVHHCLYRHALGDRISKEDRLDYLASIVDDLRLFYDPARPDWTPTQSMVDTVAQASESYFLSAMDWIEKAQPEWEEIGLEAVVIHKETFDDDGNSNQDQYAGTMDGKCRLLKANYEKWWPWQWEGSSISPRMDFKTSNALPKSVQLQMEAYDRADFIGIVETGETFPIDPSDILGCLHIGPHPSMALVTDEFGTLESRAKQIGCKFHTWPSSEFTWQAFLGLCKYANWVHNVPRSQQQRAKTEKGEKLPKTAARGVPF